MTLRDANKKLEELEIEYEYWLKEKENLLTLVMPKAMNTTGERVDGGSRIDKMLKYVETDEEKQINATVDYIHNKIINLSNYINNSLKIINEYEPLERKIIKYKEEKHMKWKDIAESVGYCERQCRRIYKKYYQTRERKRNINMSI